MRRASRVFLVAVLIAASAFAGAEAVRAQPAPGPSGGDVDCASFCQNQQDGDNEGSTDQSGSSGSGDAVGGQVTGVVSSGDASVDARNRSEKVDVQSGGVDGSNSSSSFVGLNESTSTTVSGADATTNVSFNQQEGDNELDLTQTVDGTSGDAVGGQVIGAVTSAGGSADIVADNASKKVDVETGGVDADNLDASIFVGLNHNQGDQGLVLIDDADAFSANNQQDGDNAASVDQSVAADSGDGVAGQVIGVVSAGDASVDAKNRSEKVDVETGFADADNQLSAFVGLNDSTSTVVTTGDASADFVDNQQDGDNEADLTQTVDAETGDGVGGQVIGAVTSAGGSADIVADNASKKVDITTGEAEADNDAAVFVGLNNNIGTGTGGLFIEADVEVFANGINQQDGDNTLAGEQTASAASGDGVGGQVLGVVSAGDTSLDAKNRSEKIDLETGEATSFNSAAAFVGINSSTSTDVATDDAFGTVVVNQQDGDNDGSFEQTADATSGDAVAGQVAGIVTSAGGSADAVLDNASKKIDAETGPSEFENFDELFVGLNFNELDLFIGPD